MIAVIEVLCGGCAATANVPTSDLLIQVHYPAENGRLIFDCPSCEGVNIVDISARTVATLVLSGAVHLPQPRVGNRQREDVPVGDAFTATDVYDWQEALREVESVAPWE